MWKQGRVMLWLLMRQSRKDVGGLLVILLVPSLFFVLAALSSINNTANSDIAGDPRTLTLRQCRIHTMVPCQYPLQLSIAPPFESLPRPQKQAIWNAMALFVKENYNLDFDAVFLPPDTAISPPLRAGGQATMLNGTMGTLRWTFYSDSSSFVQSFVQGLNERLQSEGTGFRFQDTRSPTSPTPSSPSSAFDLRFLTFFLAFQTMAQSLVQDKKNGMYFYLVRLGLWPSVYWISQFLWWFLLALLSIVLVVLFSLLFPSFPFSPLAYVLSAWFYISAAVLLAGVCRNPAYIATLSGILLVALLLVPTLLLMLNIALKSSVLTTIGAWWLKLPVYIVIQAHPDTSTILVGVILTIFLLLLAAYLIPLFSVPLTIRTPNDARFLPWFPCLPSFWREGQVRLPRYRLLHTTTLQLNPEDTDPEHKVTINMLACEKRFPALTVGPMTLALRSGQLVTLLGKNGVGKSTVASLLAGSSFPSAGELYLNTVNMFRDRPWSSFQQVSVCAQDNFLWPFFSVEDHLLFLAYLRGDGNTRHQNDVEDAADYKDQKTWLLTTLDLMEKRRCLASELSGGMKRRLCLAMALSGYPRAILCDEPSTGVDVHHQVGIWKALEMTKRTAPVLLTTHCAKEAEVLSDAVIHMHSSTAIHSFPALQNDDTSLFLRVKNEQDNATTSYSVTAEEMSTLPATLHALSQENIRWQMATSRVHTKDGLPSLSEEIARLKGSTPLNAFEPLDVPTSYGCEPLTRWSQTLLMVRLHLLHPDRRVYLTQMVVPIQALMIFYGYLILTNGSTRSTMFPLVPLIFLAFPVIMATKLPSMIALEKTNGIVKLLTSQGVYRLSYSLSYFLINILVSFFVPCILLLLIGSIYGTSLSMFGLFLTFSSFWLAFTSLMLLIGILFTEKVGQVFLLLLIGLVLLYGMGTSNESLTDSYPGMVGTTLGLFAIGDASASVWLKFVGPFLVHLVVGFVSATLFLVYAGRGSFNGDGQFKLFRSRSKADIEYGSPSASLLEGRNLTKVYRIKEQTDGRIEKVPFVALDDVSFNIDKGQLIGLVGLNGAGKSTLMDVLSGQTEPSAGQVFVGGHKLDGGEIAKNISLCSQIDQLWPRMPVMNAIKLFMKIRGYSSESFDKRGGICDPHVHYLIQKLKLDEVLKLKVENLSGGQKRRLSFLISLLGNTKVVLVDEAMSGVDFQTRNDMWNVLENEVKQRHRSIVVTTHDISEVEKHCNTVGILHKGSLITFGAMADIRSKWKKSFKLTILFESACKDFNIEELCDPAITIDPPVLESLSTNGKVLMTTSVHFNDESKNLHEIQVNALFEKLGVKLKSPESNVIWWCFEPYGLEDFVRALGKE